LFSHHVETPIWCTKRTYPKQTRKGLSIGRRALRPNIHTPTCKIATLQDELAE